MDGIADGDLEVRIRRLIARQLKMPVERIVDRASLASDVGLDSLDHVALIMALEQHFRITIPDDVAVRCVIVGDLVDAVRTRVIHGGP